MTKKEKDKRERRPRSRTSHYKGVSDVIEWEKTKSQSIVAWVCISAFFILIFVLVGLVAGPIGWIEVIIAVAAWVSILFFKKGSLAPTMWILLPMGVVMGITLITYWGMGWW